MGLPATCRNGRALRNSCAPTGTEKVGKDRQRRDSTKALKKSATIHNLIVGRNYLLP